MTQRQPTIKIMVDRKPEGCWECPFSIGTLVNGAVFKHDKEILYRCTIKRKHPNCCKTVFREYKEGAYVQDARND